MTDTVTFRAADLWSSHGFGDGDMLDDLLDEAGFDCTERTSNHRDPIWWDGPFGQRVVTACVRKFLLPALPSNFPVREIGGIHNPIRVVPELMDQPLGDYADIEVTVPVEAVLAIAAEIRGTPLRRDDLVEAMSESFRPRTARQLAAEFGLTINVASLAAWAVLQEMRGVKPGYWEIWAWNRVGHAIGPAGLSQFARAVYDDALQAFGGRFVGRSWYSDAERELVTRDMTFASAFDAIHGFGRR